MKVDEKATKEARRRHASGTKRLREVCDPQGRAAYRTEPMKWTGRWKPVRLRPGVPPWRTPAMKKRHLARKRARAARKRNRV
jgi:hypothetical protein